MSLESEFEDEVRRIARQLWPSAEFGGATITDSRERDGVFETEDQIHCIECTVSRGRDKAIEDGTKLEKLVKKLGAGPKFVRGWFITQNEPTAHQRDVISKYQGRVVCCSFDQFRAKLVDGGSYLALRRRYPFGSMRNPATGAAIFDLDYVPLNIVDMNGASHKVEEIASRLLAGTRVVVTGDYGAGKSSTMRQLFLNLADRFSSGKTGRFPVLLNLRDHHGQSDPVEALERHARNVGFTNPSSLVRGWRAGYSVLLLDGFDEIASAGWAGQTKRLRDLRFRSMELVRRIWRETPADSGLLMTGRAHFFDSPSEMNYAFGISAANSERFEIIEFSSEQVRAFLKRFGWKSSVPDWLPSRPLLLTYLAKIGLLDQRTLGMEAATPAVGWDHLIQRIAEREAEIEAGIDSNTVRVLIERLASSARESIDGIGPLTPDRIQNVFKSVCGYAPDDRGAVLLQRLPGLGGTNLEDGSRVFIDLDFVDAARAGDVVRFVQNPYAREWDASGWETCMTALGVGIAVLKCNEAGFSDGALSAAIKYAHQSSWNVLGTDLVAVLAQLGGRYDEANVFFKEVAAEELPLGEDGDLTGIEFQDSLFARLEMAPDLPPTAIPSFVRCHFGIVTGRTSKADLPLDKFRDCEVQEFELAANTTSALLALPLPLSSRVMLTVLKKLFVQKGSGRKDSALVRGLDTKARATVPDVLDLLKREGFVIKTKQGTDTVWLPAKGPEFRQRALTILASPIASGDLLVTASKDL